MTKDEFRERFQLFRKMAAGAVRTYHGMNRYGEGVMVHLLEGSDEQNRAMLDRLSTLRAEARDRILEITEVDGQPVVVTDFILDFESFAQWLDAPGPKAPEPRPASPEPPPEPASPAPPEEGRPPFSSVEPPPGEFTRLFGRSPSAEDPSPAAEQDAGPRPTTSPPGEFTMLFGGGEAGRLDAGNLTPADAGQAIEPGAGDPSPAPDEASAPDAGSPPGEFTLMFKVGGPADGHAAPRPQAGQQAAPDDLAPAEASETSFEARSPDEPGEFTGMFRAADAASMPGDPVPDDRDSAGRSGPPIDWPEPEADAGPDWSARLHGTVDTSGPSPTRDSTQDSEATGESEQPRESLLAGLSEPSYLDRLEQSFGGAHPAQAKENPAGGAAPPPPAAGEWVGQPSIDAGVSEYTQIVEAGHHPAAPQHASPPAAPPPGAAAAPRAKPRRKWLLPAALAGVVLVAVLLVLVTWFLARDAGESSDDPQPTQPEQEAAPQARGAGSGSPLEHARRLFATDGSRPSLRRPVPAGSSGDPA